MQVVPMTRYLYYIDLYQVVSRKNSNFFLIRYFGDLDTRGEAAMTDGDLLSEGFFLSFLTSAPARR